MNSNEQLITTFYTSFQNKDYKGMQECYAGNATFSDPVFASLNAKQVKAMWEMLLKTGKDLKLEFKNVSADEHKGSAEWIAYYTFSKTGNKVVNRIKASFVFENGKILKHTDRFDFYTWAKQSLGFTGLLLGWTPFLKNKIRKTAMQNLDNFMRSN
jgi:ketosteroid isomerase-like protein